jgi:fibronectin-binding autotransporter adhesin
VTNSATADGYSEGLAVSNNGTSGGARVGGIPGGLLVAGANTNLTVGLGGVSAVGTNSGTVTLGFQSSGTGTSGFTATNIGTQVINVIAQGYSGQALWNTDAGGSWNNFDNWDVPGGTPGIDGVLSTNDTATFGNAISSARTVSLNGQAPVLTTMTFSNASASYTIAQGSGGSITRGTPSAAQTVITNAAGTHSVSAAISLARATQVGVATNSKLSLAAVNGAQNLNKSGAGTLSITAAGDLSGSTTVTGGTLNVNGSISNSTVTVSTGATLSGSGTVGETTLANGATISPGNSPGTLTINGDLNWSGGANYNWQIYNASGTAGSGWDLINITGELDLGLLSAENTFNINLWSLSSISPSDVDGNAINFDGSSYYSWRIATATAGITNFNTNYFTLNVSPFNGTAGFSNPADASLFALESDGNSLFLVYNVNGPSPVPEPGTWAAAALLLGAAGYVRWRKRAKTA